MTEPTGPCDQSMTRFAVSPTDPRPRSVRRLIYVPGPADVLGAFARSISGQDDRGEISLTYSGSVFEACEGAGVDVLCLPTGATPRTLERGRIRIEEIPMPFEGRGGIRFYLGQLLFAMRIIRRARRFSADAALIANQHLWFLYSPLSWLGIRVIPSLHQTFWSRDHRPRDLKSRLLQALDGRFWRRRVHATIAVSEECARQVVELSGPLRSPIRVVVAQYPTDLPPPREPPPGDPFRVLFAGRIRTSKGIWEVLDAAGMLQERQPGRYRWVFAGGGLELDELRLEVTKRGLGEIVTVTGKVAPRRLLELMDECHVVVSPTRSDFREGLQKIAVEGILRGRPVVTTKYSNAFDRFGSALIECEERSAESLAGRIRELESDRLLLRRKADEALKLRSQLFDRDIGYKHAVVSLTCPHALFQPDERRVLPMTDFAPRLADAERTCDAPRGAAASRVA